MFGPYIIKYISKLFFALSKSAVDSDSVELVGQRSSDSITVAIRFFRDPQQEAPMEVGPSNIFLVVHPFFISTPEMGCSQLTTGDMFIYFFFNRVAQHTNQICVGICCWFIFLLVNKYIQVITPY